MRAGTVEGEDAGQDRKMLNDRLAIISTFDPVNAIIPSSEEAQEIASKRGRAIDPQRVLRVRSTPPRSSTSYSSTSSSSSAGSSSGPQISVNEIAAMANSVSKTSKDIKTRSHDPFAEEPVDLQADPNEKSPDAAASKDNIAAPTPPTPSAEDSGPSAESELSTPSAEDSGPGTEGEKLEEKGGAAAALDKAALAAALAAGASIEGDGNNEGAEEKAVFEAAAEDVAQVISATPADFSQKLQQFGQLLAAAERGEQELWQLFLEPGREIEERQALATQLATANSSANQSFRLLRGVAQFVGLKKVLQIPPQPPKNRKFSAVVAGLINLTQAGHKVLQPNDRQLEPLGTVLDHACACLWRLETLRLNYLLASQYPDQYNAETVGGQRGSTGECGHFDDPQGAGRGRYPRHVGAL